MTFDPRCGHETAEGGCTCETARASKPRSHTDAGKEVENHPHASHWLEVHRAPSFLARLASPTAQNDPTLEDRHGRQELL
jgi:hypothetical protein